MKLLLFSVVLYLSSIPNAASKEEDDFIVLTVASNNTDGYKRYIRSGQIYNIPITTLGKGVKWMGGDMDFAGGGQKINLLKAELDSLKKSGASGDKIVLFTDSYDVMFLGKIEDIVKKFKSFKNIRVLFSAEQFCWPDETLVTQYPTIEGKGNPYLNSGGFIGYLDELYEVVSYKPIKDREDDQLYYTNVYLNKDLREKLKISLDHKSQIFQNLNGAFSEVELNMNETTPYPFIKNTLYDTLPLILHGNGPSKTVFNSLSSYLAKAWSPTLGCLACKERRIVLNENKMPSVLVVLFIEQPTPFMEEYFKKIGALNYPKNRLHILIRNNVPYHDKHIEPFSKNASQYASFKHITPDDFIDEPTARVFAADYCIQKKCDYLFMVDSVVHLDNADTLRDLIENNLPIVAPLLARPGKAWSNFWGALTKDGFYERSVDYMDIVHLIRRGVWNVPFINSCYLINGTILSNHKKAISYKAENIDPDMMFCASLRKLGIFMHVSNEKDYGHLIDPETYDITLTNPDVYQLFENKYDWELRYIHEDYSKNFLPSIKPRQPCPDVYWFPMTTMRFCKEYIEIMEAFGKWSDGSNDDKRLEGGYEAVPTRDIHTNQVGYERHWLYILQQYVRPLQELVFLGYFHDPPRSLMNFVVRYKPDEQPSLRPHHDSSTYTINLALNTPNEDYKGGGCHFLRYNCSVVDTRPGWLLMHPGRLTHFHEGLLVTEGVRYIMISFVDP